MDIERFDAIGDADIHAIREMRIRVGVHVNEFDPFFPNRQCGADVIDCQSGGRAVTRSPGIVDKIIIRDCRMDSCSSTISIPPRFESEIPSASRCSPGKSNRHALYNFGIEPVTDLLASA